MYCSRTRRVVTGMLGSSGASNSFIATIKFIERTNIMVNEEIKYHEYFLDNQKEVGFF